MEYKIEINGECWNEIVKGQSKKYCNAICNVCRNEYKAIFNNLKRTNRTVCNGCKGKALPNYIGSKNRPLYATWCLIKRRVDNTNVQKQGNDSYYNGVNLCNEWKDFLVFEKWMLDNGWKNGLSIDRIDNDGDYEPSNCRIANHSLQMANQGLKKSNSTGYIGIGLSGRDNQPYCTRVAYEGKIYTQKRFATIKEALEHRNDVIKINNLPHKIQEYKE